MQANWSLILNILLLIGVVVAITRMIRERREKNIIPAESAQPVVPQPEVTGHDDIIAVRKINRDEMPCEPVVQSAVKPEVRPSIQPVAPVSANIKSTTESKEAAPVMIFLLAKENRQLAGYELLQTLLAAGLRFGEGQLFHRHQHTNGQGPVLCSLAAATSNGVFDLQNIGAFSVHGLCLFMHASGNPTIDAERFAIMLDTAKQLSEGLDTWLLDEQRKPLNDASLQRYYQRLNIVDVCVEPAVA
jgi:cell division protein ZipA